MTIINECVPANELYKCIPQLTEEQYLVSGIILIAVSLPLFIIGIVKLVKAVRK